MSEERRLGHATFEVAGLACRVACDYAKPVLWVTELHPGFRCERDPDVVVTFDYDDGYWARGLPFTAPDRLVDAPTYSGDESGARLRSAYYDADLDAARRRVSVRIASGFGVGGVLRALYAAWLPARGACLVRAEARPVGDGAVLVCGDACEGVVALVADGASVDVVETPFHAGTSPAPASRRRLVGVDAGGAASKATALARVLERVVVVDHSGLTVERALDVVMRLPAERGLEVGR
jgi:hypothetical protein